MQDGIQADLDTVRHVGCYGHEVSVIGHEIIDEPGDGLFGQDDDDVREQMPRDVSGRFFRRTGGRSFIKTAGVLGDGMCGGPVLGLGPGADLLCHGVIEGIVPPSNRALGEVAGAAAMVESAEISSWLGRLETG